MSHGILFPKITCILTSNGRPTMKEAITSVLDQNFKGFQLIVVDSGWWIHEKTPEANAQRWLYTSVQNKPQVE